MTDHLKPARSAIAGIAQLVLAVATGLPPRSTGRLVPGADEGSRPFLGI